MSNRAHRSVLASICLLLVCLLAGDFPVAAQEGVQLWVAVPDTSNFPTVTTYLDVRNAEGDIFHRLDQEALVVLEDGHQIPVSELRQIRPGVQVVLAFNPGPSFAIRNSQGESRLDFVMQSLEGWSEARMGSTLDDLSLLATEQSDVSHLSDIQDWISALRAYQPDSRSAVPDLDVLARAIDVAADVTARPGMGKAVLFITAPMEAEAGVGLQSLASRATQVGVHIYVWLVASTDRFTSVSAGQLSDLAESTGGDFFAYSGIEDIPDPESFLEPLRNAYFIAYNSRISTGGTHELALQVRLDGSAISSSPREFELEVLPPNVAFISPNLQIELANTAEEVASESLAPELQIFEVLIEFPDGHQRSIERSTLYVDGEVIDENRTAPFDQFIWDLSEHTSTGVHRLQVEVIDVLGLSGRSMETIVSVRIKRDPFNVLVALSRNRSLLAGISVIFAGAVLVLVLIRGGQLKPGFLLEFRRRRRRSDPVRQPVHAKSETETHRSPGWIDRLQWPQRRLALQAKAFLTPVSESGDESSRPPIAVTSNEATFGRNPQGVTHLIEDPSVDEVHARLSRAGSGPFRLSDLGSVAGTWVNYMPVSKQGMVIQHGDLIHIGQVGYRFTLRNPDRVRKPVIIPKEPES